MKRNIVILLAIVTVVIPIGLKTSHFIKQARTFDTIGMVAITMSRTLTKETWSKGYDPARETHTMFPEVRTDGRVILDAWNNPLRIEIHRLANSFSVRVVSAGVDEKFGTGDDCVREFEIKDEAPSKSEVTP
jgi:hypothetical protein